MSELGQDNEIKNQHLKRPCWPLQFDDYVIIIVITERMVLEKWHIF